MKPMTFKAKSFKATALSAGLAVCLSLSAIYGVRTTLAGANFMHKWGSRGSGAGLFNHPQGIALDTLVMDFSNNTGLGFAGGTDQTIMQNGVRMQAIAGKYEITFNNELNLKDFKVGPRTVQFDLISGQSFDFIGFVRQDILSNVPATITSDRGGNIAFTLSSPVDFSGPEWKNLSWIQVSFSGDEFKFKSFTFKVSNDQDVDGVPDDEDECPNSDLSATVIIDGCNSGVTNTVFPSGCKISDLIAACAEGASNHGQFVSCVSHATNNLKKAGTITGQQKDAIQNCAGQARIP